jgi:hypothetical protein
MATDLPLGNRPKLVYRAAAGVLFSDVALYHNKGAVGNQGYIPGYLPPPAATIGWSM